MKHTNGFDLGHDFTQSLPITTIDNNIQENILTHNRFQVHEKELEKKLLVKNVDAVHYLRSIESCISQALISRQNYTEIKNLATHFIGGSTSFFGFESHLNSPDAYCDYQFAISSKRGEREILANHLQNGNFPETFLQQTEWQKVRNFLIDWATPHSILYDNVLGFWFEFDMDAPKNKPPIPSIFLHTIPFRNNSVMDIKKYEWLTRYALPLIIGHSLPEKIEQNLLLCIKKLPRGANICQFGIMLSRSIQGMRIVVNRIQPKEIIPYLEKLGWSHGTEELSQFIAELEKKVTRICIDIDILENGIGPKIGIECSYYPAKHDQYQPEPRWLSFLSYLVEKNLCLPQKRAGLMDFLPEGTNQDEPQYYHQNELSIATKISSETATTVLVRQMGHVKIVYQPNHPLEAKAYFGARLFGSI